jgi:hypothetical protein
MDPMAQGPLPASSGPVDDATSNDNAAFWLYAQPVVSNAVDPM